MRRQYSSQHKNTKLEKWEWVSTLYNDKPSLQLTKLLVDTLFINFKTTGKSQIRLCSLLCAWQQRDPLSLFRDPLSLFLPGQMPWHELVPCGAATVLDLFCHFLAHAIYNVCSKLKDRWAWRRLSCLRALHSKRMHNLMTLDFLLLESIFELENNGGLGRRKIEVSQGPFNRDDY